MDHIAILDPKRKLLSLILSGQKTIESRWYKTRRVPYGAIKPGDKIYFKDAGKKVSAVALAEKVLFFNHPTQSELNALLLKYADGICLKERNPRKYIQYNYITLVFLKDAKPITPFDIDKTGFGNACAWLCLENVGEIRK